MTKPPKFKVGGRVADRETGTPGRVVHGTARSTYAMMLSWSYSTLTATRSPFFRSPAFADKRVGGADAT